MNDKIQKLINDLIKTCPNTSKITLCIPMACINKVLMILADNEELLQRRLYYELKQDTLEFELIIYKGELYEKDVKKMTDRFIVDDDYYWVDTLTDECFEEEYLC